jgi:hypothetical protein
MAFPGHEHTCTHAEPARTNGRPRHTVQSCSAQAGRFLRGFPGRAAALRRPQLQQPCAKTAWIGSTRPHPPRARRFFCRAASAPEGSGKIRATRRAQSALPTDGEANTGGRTADPSARHRDPRAAACAARARRSVPQKWLTRWHPASPGPLPHRRPPSPPRHHALPLRLPSECSWAAAKFCFIFPG